MSIAAVTMVHDEAVFLPLWLRHYGAAFGRENLFVIDDGSTDGSTDDPGTRNLVSKGRSPLDEDDRAALVSAFHAELLNHYDTVLYTDADEFIVTDPDTGVGLADYIRANRFTCRAPIGLEVVHRRATEAGIDFGQPLLRQRRFVRHDVEYTKPLISRAPVRWKAGFHHCDLRYEIDCNLVLFHLRSVDHALSRRRIETLNRIGFSQNSLRKDHSHQFRLEPVAYLRLLYGADDSAFGDAPEREPDRMLGARREHGDRSLYRLGARWNETLTLHPDPDADAGPGSPRVDRRRLDRLFAAAMNRMISEGPPRARNEPCPCGSGRRFKHCHGPSLDRPAGGR